MTERFELDLIRSWHPSAEERDPPAVRVTSERRESGKPHLWEHETVIHTSDGPLAFVETGIRLAG